MTLDPRAIFMLPAPAPPPVTACTSPPSTLAPKAKSVSTCWCTLSSANSTASFMVLSVGRTRASPSVPAYLLPMCMLANMLLEPGLSTSTMSYSPDPAFHPLQLPYCRLLTMCEERAQTHGMSGLGVLYVSHLRLPDRGIWNSKTARRWPEKPSGNRVSTSVTGMEVSQERTVSRHVRAAHWARVVRARRVRRDVKLRVIRHRHARRQVLVRRRVDQAAVRRAEERDGVRVLLGHEERQAVRLRAVGALGRVVRDAAPRAGGHVDGRRGGLVLGRGGLGAVAAARGTSSCRRGRGSAGAALRAPRVGHLDLLAVDVGRDLVAVLALLVEVLVAVAVRVRVALGLGAAAGLVDGEVLELEGAAEHEVRLLLNVSQARASWVE